MQNYREKSKIPRLAVAPLWGRPVSTVLSTIVESIRQINLFMQNKANVKIGKININIATIKEYNNKQRKIYPLGVNNERHSKQTQFIPAEGGTKPIFKRGFAKCRSMNYEKDRSSGFADYPGNQRRGQFS